MSRVVFALSLILLAAGCQDRPKSTPAPPKAADPAKPGDTAKTTPPGKESETPKPAAVAKTTEPAKPTDTPNTPMPAPKTFELIPREKLFGNPDKAAARMSHDGKRLSFLAPVDGVLNIWVGPIDDPSAAKPVTADKKRGIRSYFWAFTNEHLLYTQDADGNEDWNVYCVDLKSGETKNLTDLKKTRAEIESVSHKFPTEIIVGLNDRNPEYHDLYRLNFTTGEKTLIQKNDDYAGFVVDEDYKIRFASKMTEDGGSQLYKNDGDGKWSDFLKIPMEDTLTTQPAGFDKTGEILYLIDSRGRDTGALKTWNLKDNDEKLVAEDPRCDVGGIMSHPTDNTIQGVSFTYDRTIWKFFDKAVEEDFAALKKIADGEITVASRTLDDQKWIVAFLMDVGPVRYYVYDRATKDAKFLFTNRKSLEGLPLQPMQSHVIPARDGLNLVSYLTIPPGSDTNGDGIPEKPVPLVLNVHGGPWVRDGWGFDPESQLLANRGYAVLNVNFRGSTGFGKEFANAGNKQWALKMHDDLLDAVDWAVARKVTEDGKIGIMGGSYGGYATLVGLTVTPDKFACGIDIVGPSNILTLLSTIPAYWCRRFKCSKIASATSRPKKGKNS
ncbi:MAG: prolyl oligopeptidase family serine peptidase [Pirellulales bacterium]